MGLNGEASNASRRIEGFLINSVICHYRVPVELLKVNDVSCHTKSSPITLKVSTAKCMWLY